MKTKDRDKYVLDVKNTIISNVCYPFELVLMFVFVVKGMTFLGTLETESIKLLGLIVVVFASVKLIGWLHLPNLEYKPRLLGEDKERMTDYKCISGEEYTKREKRLNKILKKDITKETNGKMGGDEK